MEKIKKEFWQVPIKGDANELSAIVGEAARMGATHYECYSGNLIFFCEESENEYLQRLLVTYKKAVKNITKKLKEI